MNPNRVLFRYGLLSFIFVSAAACPATAQESWEETHNVFASNAAPDDWFGHAVGVSGDRAIVGSYRWFAGQAYLIDTRTGEQLFRLIPWDGADRDYFGRSVAISANTVVIGAPGNEGGSAYMIDATSGELLFQLWPSDGQGGDVFGWSVSVDGNRAVIGARDHNISGAAYVFDTETGEELWQLVPSDGSFLDRFGTSVAISGTMVVVGANWDDDNGQSSGSAYVFDSESGEELFKLLPTDGLAGDEFGSSVSIDGNRAVIGAPNDDADGPDFGSAYVFNTDTGEQVFKLIPSDATAGDHFGSSVAMDGDRVIIGAKDDDDNGNSSGSAYAFEVSTGREVFKFLASNGDNSDSFGASVGASGDRAIVGAPLDEDRGEQSGSAYIFERGISLALTSSCPNAGPIQINWTNATPNGNAALLYARNTGSFTIPNNRPCPGTILGLGTNQLQIVFTGPSDANGSRTLNANAPAAACGSHLQLLDLTTCTTSNVVRIE